jgi:DNA-binding HxlR family transcriptional regulator
VSSRTYDQLCPVAAALDVVGERWTLLIVRELLAGPKRFSDLRRGLPGVPSNLLSTRLSELEHAGVTTRRVLPPPAARTVYELTDEGRELETVIRALTRWGMSRLALPSSGDVDPVVAVRAGLLAYGRPRAAPAGRVWEIHLGGEVFTVTLADGRLSCREGEAAGPDLVVTTDPGVLLRWRRRDHGPELAPVLRCQPADPELLDEFRAVFALA